MKEGDSVRKEKEPMHRFIKDTDNKLVRNRREIRSKWKGAGVMS